MAYIFAMTLGAATQILAIGPADTDDAQAALVHFVRPLLAAAGVEALPMGLAERVTGPEDQCVPRTPASLIAAARARHAENEDILADVEALAAELAAVGLIVESASL